ncbi:PREDICTED: LOW QUALITY PROTEIN: zinc finger protein 280B-like [Dipodomys ordii]|uniref:LOW QUALITY PROTEIN: zinc finger protein 280B-like n=1 Tax=Dipodomys ordii TaxID=10020 RepID=A0A1S3GLQ4_DIPOR|nr:PREDICTED: LOW QUALITY PROTEIN: zinc finger protein 280B-like [Dipodomys ordii]
MDQLCLLSVEEQKTELKKSSKETQQIEDKDAEVVFVGVISKAKPVISKILNRVTPGSYSRRKMFNHFQKDTTHKSQPTHYMFPTSETTCQSELISASGPIITEPLSETGYKNDSPQAMPIRSSEFYPMVAFTSSWHHPVTATFSVRGVNESPHVAKRQCSTSEESSINPKRPKLNDRHRERCSSALPPPGNFYKVNPQQSSPLNSVPACLNLVQSESPTAFPKDSVHFKPISLNLDRTNVLAKTDISNHTIQNKNFDPKKGNLTLLVNDFNYGRYEEYGRPQPKTRTIFKCSRCHQVLINVMFMRHMRYHLEFEKQSGNKGKGHHLTAIATRNSPKPFQLQCHIDRVHTTKEPYSPCKICELPFETDQALLQNIKDDHNLGEMLYVYQVCKYRSSVFADVLTHLRKCHANTNNLLCLKNFKTVCACMCHYRGIEKSRFTCSKCRLQFLTFKGKIQHKTLCHQIFKKPKQLGLPPET